jgi:nitroreductase
MSEHVTLQDMSTAESAAALPATSKQSRPLMSLIRQRRVTRFFTDEPLTKEEIHLLLEGARWASSASNMHLHKFVVVTDDRLVGLVKQVAPGILGNPKALIVICTDLQRCRAEGSHIDRDRTRYVDVGTAAMNMLLVAEDLDLGACPVTSYSQRAVSVLLSLPDDLVPELMVLVGHPVPVTRTVRAGAGPGLRVSDLSFIVTAEGGLVHLDGTPVHDYNA